MPKTNKLRRLIYHVRHHYLTMNNIVIGIALMVGAGWAWGSVGMMQRNYDLQKEIDHKERQLKLAELETEALAYQQKYYQSDEYRELAAKEYLGLARPGEKVLILPPNTQAAKQADDDASPRLVHTTPIEAPSNVEQWLTFLLGGNREDL